MSKERSNSGKETSLNEERRKRMGQKILEWYQGQEEVEFHTVPHSHLDYAWYREREASKMREVEAFVKTLLVKTFTLEQMVTAEEFIDFAGEKLGAELLQMIEEKRMELISMYSQPDHFLSPQQLRFWNYQLGEQIVKKLGGDIIPIEYLPDTFGGDEMTPTIIAHAGRDAIITFRGDEDNPPLSWWKGPDGTKILRILMQGGYANASGLSGAPGHDRNKMSPEDYFEKQVDHATDMIWGHIERYGDRYMSVAMPHALIMNGNDFTNPDMDLPRVLEAVEKRMRLDIPNFRIFPSTLGAYTTKVFATMDPDKLPVFEGEMRSGKEHYVLRGIDSARMELKQRMHEVGTRTYESGALISMLILARNAGLVPDNEHESWQQVIAWWNANKKTAITGSHDTVAGCGDDRTYDLAKALMTGAYGATDQAARNSMAALAKRRDTYGPYQHKEHTQSFANTLSFQRTTLVEIPLQGELERDKGMQMIATHSDGREVAYPAQIIQKVDSRYALSAIPIEGLGSVQVRIEPIDGKPFEQFRTGIRNFENKNYRLNVKTNGTLEITDKRTGVRTNGLLFEDVGDRGDEYNFCPTDDNEITTTHNQTATVNYINDGPVFTEFEIVTQMTIPDGLDGPEGTTRETTTRSSNMITVPISTKVRMYKDPAIDRIEFATTVDNKARDHRMRVRFDTPNAGKTVRAKEPYGLTTRSAVPISGGEGWKEPLPVATSHNQGLITTGDVTIYNKGLAEHEALTGHDENIDGLAITLFRSVSHLSKGNLSTRPGWAGPGSATPEAQMIGKRTYEYALGMGKPVNAGDVINKMYDYMHRGEHGFAGADLNGLLDIQTDLPLDRVEFTPMPDGESFIATFANPNHEPARIKLGGKFANAVKSNGLGEIDPDNVDMRSFIIKPRGMVSVRIS